MSCLISLRCMPISEGKGRGGDLGKRGVGEESSWRRMVRRNYGRKAIYQRRIKQLITKKTKQMRKTSQVELRWFIGDETEGCREVWV